MKKGGREFGKKQEREYGRRDGGEKNEVIRISKNYFFRK